MSRSKVAIYPTRRKFLTQSAAALAGVGVSSRVLQGMAVTEYTIPHTRANRRTTYNHWLPDAPADAQFRALALVAMDAARQAGADFADIRIGAQRECGNENARIGLGYGIRTRVGGTWSFEHGTVLTRDAIAAHARSAVIGAQTAAKINGALNWHIPEPFAEVPVATGEWRVPADIDPFTVPLDDFYRAQHLMTEPARRLGYFVGSGGYMRWIQETRVFASTEGSLVTQFFTRGGADYSVSASLPGLNGVGFSILRPDGESAGFEIMLRTDFAERLEVVAEQCIRWRELPNRVFDDVGRFPVVFDSAAFSAIIGQTLNFALDGDRLSGNESDASGRSFLQPFSAHPLQPPPEFSPLLTVTSSRALPSSTAVQWDDDGVASTPCTLVDRGTVSDFHTTRETAPLFADWYKQRGRPYQLHGRSFAPTPASLPMSSGGDVVVSPSAAAASEADLYRDMAHGFLMKGAKVDTPPGLTTGLLRPEFVVEIVKGKPVAIVGNLSVAFLTNAVLKKGLLAIGDRTTVGTSIASTQKGMPWQQMTHPVTSAAAYCKEVDILRMDLSR